MRYSEYTEFEKVNVFGIGFPNDAFAQYFIGKSYLNPLMKLGKTDISIAGSPRTVSGISIPAPDLRLHSGN
ncbi:MAG: hypothetical protein ACLU6B_02585 [Lachnospirales bacterium]